MYKNVRPVSVGDSIPTLKLNNGYEMPVVGLGMWQSPKGKVKEAVEVAIDAGYRHIDCALSYENEDEVGEGIKTKINDGTVKREDLFITSKLWNTHHRVDLVRKGLQTSLDSLKVTYVDLYLMHWPLPLKEEEALMPTDSDGKFLYSDVDFLDTYKEMEKLVDDGLVKTIGVSNFNSKQVQRIIDNCRIKPAMNQVEVNVYFNNQRLIDYCQDKGVAVTAYSPLGAPERPWVLPEDQRLLDDPEIAKLAHKYNKSVAQLLIRHAMQRGLVVIPKSVTPSRIRDNIRVTDFKISEDDMRCIQEMDKCFRACVVEFWSDAPYYPFNEPF